MPATLTTLDAITKEIYPGKGVAEQLNNDVVTLRRIEKTSDGVTNDVGGRYVTFPIRTRRNQGIGARSENGVLPTAGQQGTAAARVGLKYLYGSVELTGQALSLINTNVQAFMSALDLEMSGLRDDLALDLNRQMYADGTGVIGTVRSVVTSTIIPVDRADLFQLDEVVDLCTLPSTVATAGRTITAIDLTPGANTITISGAAVTTVVGQILVRTGNLNKEWTGLGAIVKATGTLYNINPSTEPVWTANVNGNGGTPRSVSETLFTTMADTIRTRGGSPTAIFYNLGVRRAYANLLQQQRQFVNTKEFTGGFSGLAFQTDKGEIPMVVDIMAPPKTASFINEKALKIYREGEWDWLDQNGSKWQQKIDSNGRYDAWQATMKQYSEIGTDRRNSHGRIDDLIEA